MRHATLLGLFLIALVLISSSSAMACGFPMGRCFVPYYCCGPCYVPCCPVQCYSYSYCSPCYSAPVECQPCQPACCQPAADAPKAAPRKAVKQQKPTLAPPEPAKVEEKAPVVPMLETKAPQPTKPVEKKEAPKSPSKIMLPSELSLPTTPNDAPKAAEGNQLPGKRPVAPAAPKARPVERPMSIPSEKPLVAEASYYDNPFILETDQLQIWTDSTGNFRIEARFVSFDEKTVRLQRPSGQYIRVAYERLSMADRARVRDLSLALAMKTSMK